MPSPVSKIVFPAEPLFFPTPADLRKWFQKNHDKAADVWVGFYKKGSGKPSITWPESVDQALCFGWIDGIRKSIDAESYMIRFTPRKPKSVWSDVNIKRIRELIEQNLVHANGLQAFEEYDKNRSLLYSYEQRAPVLDEAYEKKMKANKKAWEFFQSQPPGYRRTASWWVMSAKKEETRWRRLDTLIEDCLHERRIKQLVSPQKPT